MSETAHLRARGDPIETVLRRLVELVAVVVLEDRREVDHGSDRRAQIVRHRVVEGLELLDGLLHRGGPLGDARLERTAQLADLGLLALGLVDALAQVGVDANQADGARARDLADVHERGEQARDHEARDERHGRPLVADPVDQHRRGVHGHRPRRTQAERDLCGSPEPVRVAAVRRREAPGRAPRSGRGRGSSSPGRRSRARGAARRSARTARRARSAPWQIRAAEPTRRTRGAHLRAGSGRPGLSADPDPDSAARPRRVLRASGAPAPSLARPLRSTRIRALKDGVVREEELRLVLPARRALSGLRLGDVGPVAHRAELLVLDLGLDHPGEDAGDRSCVGLELGVLLALEGLPELERRGDSEGEDDEGRNQAGRASPLCRLTESPMKRRRWSCLIPDLIQWRSVAW